ncbi:unnamed protein product [Camellia sinensis]
MSGEKEDWSEFFDWLSSVDSPTDGLLGDFFSDANINPCNPNDPFTSLHQHQPPSSPKCNLSDTTTTISLPTSTCLSLFAKYRFDLESESVKLQKLGDEAQLEAETLKPIPGFMIEETMTNSLRFLIESTAQYALSQISATVENLHQSALTTSLQPLVLDLHNNGLHRCKIASLIYMFSLDSGMGVDCGHHSHAFLLKLPFWNPNVQFYYRKEPVMLNHAQYYNVRGTLALPVFEASRQSCVGVLELIMTSQKISYAPEHILQTARSPLQPQARQNGGPIENGSNVISACQSHNAVVLSEIEDTGESSKIKSGKKEESIGLEILHQHFHLTLLDAASRLNVSRSTLKRICRKLGISEWPSRKRNKLKPVDESVPSAGANDPNLYTSPSLLSTVVVLDQPKPPGSELQREKGKSLCYRTEVGFGQVERLLDYMPGGYHNELRVQTGILQEFGRMTPKENLFVGVTNEQCSKVGGSSELVFQPTRPNPSIAHCNPDAILSTLSQTPSRDLLLIRSSEGFSENAVLASRQRTGPAPKRIKTNLARAVPNFTASIPMTNIQSQGHVHPNKHDLIVKATYGEDMIRFRFPSTSGIIELKNELTKRLPLKVWYF